MKKKTIFWNLLCAALTIFMIIPIYYLLVTTFKTPAEAAAHPLGLPAMLTLENYKKALGSMEYLRALKNNMLITGCSLVILLIISSMAAYVIARGSSRLFRFMFSVFMIGLIVPFQIAIIPLYKIISGLHLMNTFPGVIIIDVFCINLPLSIFLFRGDRKSVV